jgi:hypothetical protein
VNLVVVVMVLVEHDVVLVVVVVVLVTILWVVGTSAGSSSDGSVSALSSGTDVRFQKSGNHSDDMEVIFQQREGCSRVIFSPFIKFIFNIHLIV